MNTAAVQLPERVRIVEVGPRDGLQNEPEHLPTDIKIQFINALIDAGLKNIELTSFVHPRAIPQLADASAVIAGVPRKPGVTRSALVPNEKGLERAFEAGIERIAVFTAASDSFAKRNINMSVSESLQEFEKIVPAALAQGVSVRGYVSTCFVCPYEGHIDPGVVDTVVRQLLDLGVDEVAVSDTIGAAVPTDIQKTCGMLLESVNEKRLALHLHDTYGTALANVYAGLQLGLSTFDASAGGLGGCPYAPGASGNLATEDLLYLLNGMGIECDGELVKVADASRIIARHFDRKLPARQLARLDG